MKPEKKDREKTKIKKNNPLSFKGMPFEEALLNLLKVKPERKTKKKHKRK